MSGGAPVGNGNAKKAKEFAGSLRRALAKLSNGEGVAGGLDKISSVLIDAALAGQPWAIQEIANRLDGKPAQIIVGDDEQPPIRFEKIERVIVNAEAIDG